MATYIVKTNTELYNAVKKECREAMKETVEECLKQLGRIIQEDVYSNRPSNAETRRMRTKWLLAKYRDIFEANIYNAFGQGLAMSIKPDLGEEVPSNPIKFQHGSAFGNTEYSTILNMKSYLEMLNDPNFIAKAGNNPFHFPWQVDREPFWDDFVKWCEENFVEIFKEKLSERVELRNIPYMGLRYMPKY